MWPTKNPSQIESLRETGRRLHVALVDLLGVARVGAKLGELRERGSRQFAELELSASPPLPPGSGIELRVDGLATGSSPDHRVLTDGDLLTVDLFAAYRGWWADCARTVPIGRITPEQGRFLHAGRRLLRTMCAALRTAATWEDVRVTARQAVEAESCTLIPELRGHAIGRELHESPSLSWESLGPDIELRPGMTLALEPTLAMRRTELVRSPSGDLRTRDGSPVVHFEDCVALTDTGPQRLTGPTLAPGDENLILIGMPGAGKSSVGRAFASAHGLTFLDLDDAIQSGEGRSLKELIDAHGFDGFLEIEARYARQLDCRRTVVAPGGSVVYRPDAMEAFAARGRVVAIRVPVDELAERLSDLRQRGVVISSDRTLDDLWAERVPLYEAYADEIVDAGGLSPDQIAERLSELFPNG